MSKDTINLMRFAYYNIEMALHFLHRYNEATRSKDGVKLEKKLSKVFKDLKEIRDEEVKRYFREKIRNLNISLIQGERQEVEKGDE